MCLEAQLWLNWLGTTRFYQVYQTDRARTERLLVKVFKLIRFTKRTVGYPGPSTYDIIYLSEGFRGLCATRGGGRACLPVLGGLLS